MGLPGAILAAGFNQQSQTHQEIIMAVGGIDVEIQSPVEAIAADYFSNAKGGELQTPHPYHCEARMYYYRAQRFTDYESKLVTFCKALEVISEAEDNIPDESLPKLLELRAEILDDINRIPDLNQVISTLEKTPESQVDGALARAKLTLLDHTRARQDKERALEILEKMTPENANNSELLRTYYRLLKDLYPTEREKLYKILNLRYQLPTEKRNFSLLYDLGILSFSFEDYAKSLECFKLLEKISQGHPKRWGIYDRGTDKAGKVREFQGTIVRIESRSLGHVDVPEIRRVVPFLPYAQDFVPEVGKNVTFKIGFNYRGWLAIDLVK